MAVFTQPMAQDIAHEYHLRTVAFPTRIHRGYLFIRFAWNVLKFLTPGLEAAAAAIRPPEERPDGGGFLKRKRVDDTGSGSNKSIGGDGVRKPEDVGGGGELSEDGDSAPTREDEDEAQLAVFETLDAALQSEHSLSCSTCLAHSPPSQIVPSPSTMCRPGDTLGIPGSSDSNSSTDGPTRRSPKVHSLKVGAKTEFMVETRSL